MLSVRLDDVENKRALVMESTVRMLTPDDGSFERLSEQMLAYAPYGENVLARFIRVVLEETTRKPAFALAYGALIERLVKRKCLSCPPSHFRRVLLLAVEDAGVRLLKRQEDVMHRRALETLGWARYQKRLADLASGGGDGQKGAADATSFYDAVVDRESYAEYKAFRDECKALQGILRDLYENRKLLLPEDLRDVAAGFPGSEHSVGVEKSAEAWKKATFFKGLTRWRSAGDDAARDATRAAAAQLTSWHRDEDDANVVKQRGAKDPNPPVPRRGVDDAAWEGADGDGWEAYRDGDATGDDDDIDSRYPYPRDRWASHFERRRGEEDTLDPVFVGVDARDAEEESLARLRREERAERDGTFETDGGDRADGDEGSDVSSLAAARRVAEHRRRVGVDGSRVIERALAASSHRDNVVMTSGRAETLKHMARIGGAEEDEKAEENRARLVLEKTESGARAARARKLELKLAEMAARGVPELHVERFKVEAQTKPELGFTTQQDVDAASPTTQRAWRKAAFKFRALDLEAGGGGGEDWLG
jgi:hypothetical protein